MTRQPPAHRRKKDPFGRAQLAPRIRLRVTHYVGDGCEPAHECPPAGCICERPSCTVRTGKEQG